MEARLQRRVQRYGWDKAAERYEMGWRDSLAPAQQALLRMAAPRPGEWALDIACGTGLVTLPLAEGVGVTGHVLATDLSERMVERLAAAAQAARLSQIETARADAEALTVAASSAFDLVTCALGLMYVPDPSQAMTEVLRVLKPGGRAVFAVWGERRKCGWADIFPIVDARVQSAVCPLFFRLGTRDTLARAMTDAGFEYVEAQRIEAKLHYADDHAALDAAFAGGPVALAYDRFDAATREAAHAEYLASIAAYRVGGAYSIPGEFVVAHGRRTASQ